MALSTQTSYIMPLPCMLQLKSELNEKADSVGNTYSKPLQQITLQAGLCRGNPSTQKISRD